MRKINVGKNTWNPLPKNEQQKEVEKKHFVKVQESKWNPIPKGELEKEVVKTGQQHVRFEPSTWHPLPKEELDKEVARIESGQMKIQPQSWNELSGIQEPEVIRLFEGVNQLNSFAIKDSQATRNKNVTTTNYPTLSVRTGGSMVATKLPAAVDGIGVRAGSELHVIAGGTWYKLTGSTWTSIKTGLTTGKKWTFINFQGGFPAMNLIATNGTDAPLKYDGTTVTTLGGAPADSNFVATHDNRVYIASKSDLLFSALRKAEDYTTVNDSGRLVVETADGRPITGTVAGAARLTVFKNRSIHELFGTNPSNYTMRTVTENLGSPTGNSAQVINGNIYFLGNDSIYRYSGGTAPSNDFAVTVRDYVASLNRAYADQSMSWTIQNRYYLAIPTGSNTSPDTVLEFDTDFNSWNVWKFPYPITSKGAIFNGVTYIGNSNGEVIKLDGTSTDNGTTIAWEWVSKPFTFASIAAKARWYRLWLVADLPAGSTMNVHLSGDEDGENWTLVQSVTTNANAQAKEILIPTTLVSNNNWIRVRLEGVGPATVYEFSRQERIFPMGQH